MEFPNAVIQHTIFTIAYLSPQIYFLFVEITLNVFHKYLECDCHVGGTKLGAGNLYEENTASAFK